MGRSKMSLRVKAAIDVPGPYSLLEVEPQTANEIGKMAWLADTYVRDMTAELLKLGIEAYHRKQQGNVA
jgi:hypothetical protein